MNENQRVVLTKRLLQDALLRLVEKKPLYKISVSELCTEAGINRATFYRHYYLPRDILNDMQADFVERAKQSVSIEMLVDSPAKYIEKVCTLIYENSDIVRLFIKNNSEDEIMYFFDDFFEDLLCKNELFKESELFDEDDKKLVKAYLSGGGYFMLRRWLLDDIDKSPVQVSKLVISFLKKNGGGWVKLL